MRFLLPKLLEVCRTEEKCNSHGKICKNYDKREFIMPNNSNNILKYHHGEKSIKYPLVVYVEVEAIQETLKTLKSSFKGIQKTLLKQL